MLNLFYPKEHAVNIGVKNCFIQVGKIVDKDFITNFNLDVV